MVLGAALVGLGATPGLGAAPAPAANLDIAMEVVPPYVVDQGGAITGIVPDLLAELSRRAGQTWSYRILPWQRALALAGDTPATCTLAGQTDERRPRFVWIGPLLTDASVLVAHDRGEAPPRDLGAVKGKRIGGYQGDARSMALEAQGYQVDLVVDDLLNVAKLEAGRIDYWITGEAKALLIMRQPNHAALKIVLRWEPQDIYLACNPRLEPGALQAVQTAWRQMVKDGAAARLNPFQRY